MIFIDGGYLRRNLCNIFGTPYIDYFLFVNSLNQELKAKILPQFSFELIRTYYYDAEDKQSPSPYIDEIRAVQGIEVRLGYLLRLDHGFRQKGVDSLIALDMLSKSYENQYDIAVVVAGDRDFLDIVRAIKNSGKRVYGAFFNRDTSEELRTSFDWSFVFTKEWLQNYIMEPIEEESDAREKIKQVLKSPKKEILLGLHKFDIFKHFEKETVLDDLMSSKAKKRILLHRQSQKSQFEKKARNSPNTEIRIQNSSLPLKNNILIVDQKKYLKMKFDGKKFIFGIYSTNKPTVNIQISRFEEEWELAEKL